MSLWTFQAVLRLSVSCVAGSVEKAWVDVSRRVKDALDSDFVGGFVNRVKNQVATKRRNTDTGPDAFPQRGTYRRVQNQETAGADFFRN